MVASSIASSVSSYMGAPARPEGYGRLTRRGREKVDGCSHPSVEELLPKIRRRKWRQIFKSILAYLFSSLGSWLGKCLLSPSTIFLDPVGTVASITVLHPLIFLVLCGAACGLYIASLLTSRTSERSLGFSLCRKVSIINWPNAGLFESEEAKKVLHSALPTLSGLATTFRNAPLPLGPAQDPAKEFETTRIFDVDVAKTLLMLSALVYERLDEVTSLSYEYAKLGKNEEANTLRRLSARDLGLRFEALNEPGVWGPFASLFYTQENDAHPFIMLVLKGTTPDNFAEFLIDARISRVSSAVFFGDGTVHEGFMRELFVMEDTTDPTNRVRDYDFITARLRALAQQMRTPGGAAVQVWVTGHSLGSALASLLFARYLRMPSDLGPDIQLRDCYAFGTPRLGDAAFVSKFEESLASPVGRPNILWRVVNNSDIVCKIPPGCANRELRRAALTPFSVLNYGHLGVKVFLNSSSEGCTIRDRAFHNTTRVLIVKDGPSGPRVTARKKLNFSDSKKKEPLETLFAWMPSLFWDHYIGSYWARLDAMSAPYQGGEARRDAGAAGAFRRNWMSPAQEQQAEKRLEGMEGYATEGG